VTHVLDEDVALIFNGSVVPLTPDLLRSNEAPFALDVKFFDVMVLSKHPRCRFDSEFECTADGKFQLYVTKSPLDGKEGPAPSSSSASSSVGGNKVFRSLHAMNLNTLYQHDLDNIARVIRQHDMANSGGRERGSRKHHEQHDRDDDEERDQDSYTDTNLHTKGNSNANIVSETNTNTHIRSDGKTNTNIDSQGKTNTDIRSHRQANTKISSDGTADTAVKSRDNTKTKINSGSKANTDIHSDGHADTRIRSERQANTAIRGHDRADTAIESHGQANTAVRADGAANTHIRSNGKTNTGVVSGGKANTEIDSQGKTNTAVRSKGAADTDIHSEGASNTAVESHGKTNTHIRGGDNTNTAVRSKGQTDTRVKSQGETKTDIRSDGKTFTKIRSQERTVTNIKSRDHTETNIKSYGNSNTNIHSKGNTNTNIYSEGDANINIYSRGASSSTINVHRPRFPFSDSSHHRKHSGRRYSSQEIQQWLSAFSLQLMGASVAGSGLALAAETVDEGLIVLTPVDMESRLPVRCVCAGASCAPIHGDMALTMTAVDSDYLEQEQEGVIEEEAEAMQLVHANETALCVNEHDEQILADAEPKAFFRKMRICALQTFGNRRVASGCMQQKTDLSEGCSSCFGGALQCAFKHCAGACLGPSHSKCADCALTHCQAPFALCSGMTPRQMVDLKSHKHEL